MSRQIYNANNKVGQTLSFQHQSFSGASDPEFNPIITMKGGKRVHWDFGDNNTSYVATNTPGYTYNDTGTTKEVTIRTQRLSDIIGFSSTRDKIIGNLDLSGLELEGDFRVNNSIGLTGVTHTYSDGVFTEYRITNQFSSTQATDITGNHDLTMFPNLGGDFLMYSNPNLTGITHTASTQVFTNYDIASCNILGNHDVSMLTLGGIFDVASNNNLTGITHGYTPQTFTVYLASNCNLTGNHDMSMLPGLGGDFRVNNNTNLTGITHTASTQVFTRYQAGDCDLRNTLDLTMFPNLGGIFNVIRNNNLQGITHTASTQLFTSYLVSFCDLQGEHDISMLTNLSNSIQFRNNASLTAVTRSFTTNNINSYVGRTCNIIGNHDMTLYPNLGGDFQMQSNPNLTGITHTATTRTFTNYELNACNITGNHDMSMITALGGNFNIASNPNLTGVTHTASTEVFTNYNIAACDIQGTHDLSMFPNLGGTFLFYANSGLTDFNFHSTGSTETFTRLQGYDCDLTTSNFDLSIFPNIGSIINLHNNPNLSGITFPLSTQTFKNRNSTSNNDTAIGLNGCSLGYVNFHPLSGATMDPNATSSTGCDIFLQNNGMTTAEVNHILEDLSGITTNNLSTWSGLTLNIGGTNAAPDGSTGGYDGLSAVSYLTGATPSGGGWTVITS
jgi:hypothetical protein